MSRRRRLHAAGGLEKSGGGLPGEKSGVGESWLVALWPGGVWGRVGPGRAGWGACGPSGRGWY